MIPYMDNHIWTTIYGLHILFLLKMLRVILSTYEPIYGGPYMTVHILFLLKVLRVIKHPVGV